MGRFEGGGSPSPPPSPFSSLRRETPGATWIEANEECRGKRGANYAAARATSPTKLTSVSADHPGIAIGGEDRGGPGVPSEVLGPYCTVWIMSKIGKYIDTTIPPTMIPRNTIMIGSITDVIASTAASTS